MIELGFYFSLLVSVASDVKRKVSTRTQTQTHTHTSKHTVLKPLVGMMTRWLLSGQICHLMSSIFDTIVSTQRPDFSFELKKLLEPFKKNADANVA